MNQNALLHDYTIKMQKHPAASITDSQLLQLLGNGNEQAFDKLYQRHSKPIYNYLRHLIHEPNVADELLQDVFVAVWRQAGSFRSKSKVTTWLFRIAHNQAVSWLRKQRKVSTLDGLDDTELSADEDSLEQVAMNSWRAEQVWLALDKLSPNHRAVLELTFFHGFSYTEIAEIMNCPVGTVKSRMSHARRQISHILKELGVENNELF